MSYYIQNAKKNWPTILRIRMNVSSHHRWQWNFLIACTSPGNWLYYFFSYNLYDWAWRDAPACNRGQIAISFWVADGMSTHTERLCMWGLNLKLFSSQLLHISATFLPNFCFVGKEEEAMRRSFYMTSCIILSCPTQLELCTGIFLLVLFLISWIMSSSS
jgi:hypothetical protein